MGRLATVVWFVVILCACGTFSADSKQANGFGRGQNDGWSMEVEVEIGRNPPIFDPRDDLLNLGCTLQQTRSGSKGQPPLVPGSVLMGEVGINEVVVAYVEWPELHYVDGSKGTVLIAYLNLAIPLDGFAAPETYNLSLIVDTGTAYGELTAWVSVFTEESSAELWDLTYPTAPESGPVSTLLHEGMRTAEHWDLLRSFLFSTPFVVSKQELSVLRELSPTFYGQNNDDSLHLHFPPEAFPERFSSCAVVGNAGHLHGSNLGAEIDSHEVIIRFNEAPTQGFEEDVGSRTTHRIVHATDPIRNYLRRRWANAPGRELLIFFPTSPSDLSDMLHFQGLNGGGGVYMVSPAFILFVRSVLGLRSTDKSPTSGVIGLLRAIQVCDHVQTYGFGTYQPPKMDPELCKAGMECSSGRREGGRSPKAYRYFDSSDERPWAYGHKWNREEAMHQEWHAMRLLTRRF